MLGEGGKEVSGAGEMGMSAAGAVSALDGETVWQRMLEEISRQEPSMAGVLKMARMDGFRDGQAVIIFPAGVETFGRAWQSNGKRERIADLLTQITGQPTGAIFEFAPAAAPTPEPAPTTAAAPTAPPPAANQSPRIEPNEPIATIKASDPRVQAALADPNVRKILAELGGTPVTLDGLRII